MFATTPPLRVTSRVTPPSRTVPAVSPPPPLPIKRKEVVKWKVGWWNAREDGPERTVFSLEDFNCRIATFQDKVINDTGRHLMALAEGMELLRPSDLGYDGSDDTRVEYRTRRKGSTEIQESSPDGWMANAAAAELVLNMEVTEEHFGSDHWLVVMTTRRSALPPKALSYSRCHRILDLMV